LEILPCSLRWPGAGLEGEETAAGEGVEEVEELFDGEDGAERAVVDHHGGCAKFGSVVTAEAADSLGGGPGSGTAQIDLSRLDEGETVP